MKRKEFIRNVSFIGAGLGLAPWNLVTGEPSIQTFRLPAAAVHIPHGNFASSELKKLTISEFDLECSVQLFMRNGISPCEDDLKVFSFQSAEEWMCISLTRVGESVKRGDIRGMEVHIDSFDSPVFSMRKRKARFVR